MARTAREISPTGKYHIVAGSCDSRVLFYNDEDYMKFADILERFRSEKEFGIDAWCLMNTHFHLLLTTSGTPSTAMKKIENSYVYYYNNKYMNSEPLFRDRFRSEVIADRESYLSVVRYIYNSPARAGICDPEEYPWNSFRRDGYAPYEGLDDGMKHADLPDYPRIRDDEIGYYFEEFKDRLGALNYPEREIVKIAVSRLHDEGASIRQLARVTGLNRGRIERFLASKRKI